MAKPPRAKASKPDFAAQIAKTGFVLENSVAELLKAAGWNVISNKYYVDDHQETVREIDLVAYKASKVGHLSVYTSLILSCKKSEKDVWAFLSRDIDLNAPNSNWTPIHAWTNDKPLNFTLKLPKAASDYHGAVQKMGVTEALRTPSVDVFAFQEMDVTSGAPHNDKAIFGSVTSLMKAQAYELSALPKRKKDPVVYQFNLLSIVDAEMYRLRFGKNGAINASSIDDEQYIARYIIQGRETFSRVRFMRPKTFAQNLSEYTALHVANCKWFSEKNRQFFEGALQDLERRSVFEDEFWVEIDWFLRYRSPKGTNVNVEKDRRGLVWDSQARVLNIEIDADEEALVFFNHDDEVKKHVAAVLKAVYHYSGSFAFNSHIPF
jgi:hypothetical protein